MRLAWPACVPILFLALQLRAHRAIAMHRPTSLSRATSFLWSEYEDAYYLWEPLEMLRKLTLVGYVLLIPEVYDMLRLLVAILVSVAFVVLQLVCKPFKRASDDWLNVGGQLIVLCTFIACIPLQWCDDADCTQMGMSEFQASLVVLVFTFVVAVIIFVDLALAVTVVEEVSAAALEVMATT